MTTTTTHTVPSGTIARGAFGEIRLGFQIEQAAQKSTTRPIQLVALKQVRLEQRNNTNDNNTNDLDEIACLEQLCPHPNIVPLLDYFAANDARHDKQLWSLALPYCPLDLYTTLEWKRLGANQHQLLSESTLHRISSHLFQALEHCHAHHIVHGDIKPGNLLIHVESASLLLCDFGIAEKESPVSTDEEGTSNQTTTTSDANMDLNNYDGDDAAALWMQQQQQKKTTATTLRPQRNQKRALCTLQYRPPELLLGETQMHSSLDLFSAGLVLADCVTLRNMSLFSGTNDLSQLSLYMDALGTPHSSSSLEKLPDWGKLEFTQRPHHPNWHWQRIPQLSDYGRASRQNDDSYPESWISRLLYHTVQLEPQQRWTAQQCCAELRTVQQQQQPDNTEKNDPTIPITKTTARTTESAFLKELVPPTLRQVPLLLSLPGDDGNEDNAASRHVIHRQLQTLAKERRDFLSLLHPWNQFTKLRRQNKERAA